jgi:hypothetical protein
VTSEENDAESVAVLLADGRVAFVVSITPLSSRPVADAWTLGIDLAAVEAAWREGS